MEFDMDSSLSAFVVYQNRNKKRKIKSENRNAQKRLLLSKKIKKAKAQKENQKGLSESKPKKHKELRKLMESDDEIPTLVPIINENLSKEVVSNTNNIETVIRESSYISNNKSSNNKLRDEILSSDRKLDSPQNVVTSSFNPVTQGLAIFKWLIYPTSVKEFFEKYWEKDILFIKRLDHNYFKDVFSCNKLDNILREYPLHFTRNVDVVVYENGEKQIFNQEGRAVPSQLWDYYSNGCSIRVLNPQTYDQNVHALISSLQEYFGTMVGTNVYLTPPRSQGFAPHFDDIEAFILQLEGRKHWKLYRPKNEDVLARDSSPNFKSEDLGEPCLEVTLNAGDLLYFPRGTIHEGRTEDDAHSLHITVSVYQHTAYVDLLEHILPEALKKAASQDVEFRKGLPLNYLKHVGVVNKNEQTKKRKLIIDKVKILMEKLQDYIDVDFGADKLGRKFMYDAMPPLYAQEEAYNSSKFDGVYMTNGKVLNRVEIGVETKIRLLRYYSIRIAKENENTSKMYYCTDNAKSYHGEEEQWLEIDNSLIPGIAMLQKKYPEFQEVDLLPIQDESAKLQLVSDLWERGLLVTDAPLPSISSDIEDDDNNVSSSGQEIILGSESD